MTGFNGVQKKGRPHGLPSRKAGKPSACARLAHPGRGHRPCHSATLTLGRPGAKAPGQRPPRPRRALLARRVGRWPAVGAGRDGPGGSVAQGRGKRGAFPVPAQRGNPFTRIGKSFPAGRRSDCFFSTLSDSHFHSRCDFGLSQQLNRCLAGWQGQRWRSGRVTCPSSLNDRRHIREIGMTFPFTGRGLPMTVAPP